MKSLRDSINENSVFHQKYKPSFKVQNDIYNVLAELGTEYEFANKDFDEKEVQKALKFFMDRYFEEPDEEFDD